MAAKDKKRILTIMRRTCNHAYLATMDGKQPVVRSVSPILDNNLGIWIATFANANKVKQVKKNPRVCLEFISQPNGDQRVHIVGRAKLVTSPVEKKEVWKLADYNLAGYFPAGPESKHYGVLKIKPSLITWRASWTRERVYKP